MGSGLRQYRPGHICRRRLYRLGASGGGNPLFRGDKQDHAKVSRQGKQVWRSGQCALADEHYCPAVSDRIDVFELCVHARCRNDELHDPCAVPACRGIRRENELAAQWRTDQRQAQSD
ncbi:hypothetical protein D3C78_1356950 [compost metagenome]